MTSKQALIFGRRCGKTQLTMEAVKLMKKEQIEKMEAGPAMDVRVASHVMFKCPIDDKGWMSNENGLLVHIMDVEPYSTDIRSAWEVVEKIKLFENYHLFKPYGLYEISKIEYSSFCDEPPDALTITLASALTAPLAICRAALLSTL